MYPVNRPYTSIEKFRERNLQHFSEKLVVGTEKIHGTNFRLIGYRNSDGDISVHAGKRNTILEKTDDFFGSQKIITQYHDKVVAMMDDNPTYSQVDIIGELFGGNYHGEKTLDSKTIQKGKYANYAKNNDIRVFDVHIDDKWLTWDETIEFGKIWGLHVVPEVFRGTWEDVKAFDVETFQSLLANQINGPGKSCPAEGVVVCLLNPITKSSRNLRVKWKCEEMLEGVQHKPRSVRPEIENMDTYLAMMDLVRFDNFQTKKIYEFDDQHIGKNIGWLVDDVIKDIQDDEPNLESKIIKSLRGPLNKKAKKFIFDYMKTI